MPESGSFADRYWLRAGALGWLVTFWNASGTERRDYRWTRIVGIRIGPWFIGAIRGTEVR